MKKPMTALQMHHDDVIKVQPHFVSILEMLDAHWLKEGFHAKGKSATSDLLLKALCCPS